MTGLLAIDAGTGSCRAALFDLHGRQLALAQREWSHAAVNGVPGSQAFDADHNWQLICECIRECLAIWGGDPHGIAAVSSTSMREGIVLYDGRDREIWAVPNADARADREVCEL